MAISFAELEVLSDEDRALAIRARDLTAQANARLTHLANTKYESGHVELARENLLQWAERAVGAPTARFEVSISGTSDVKGKLNDYISTVERALEVKTSISDIRRSDDKRKTAMEKNLGMKLTRKEYNKLANYIGRMADSGHGSEGYVKLMTLTGRQPKPKESGKTRKQYFEALVSAAEQSTNTVDALLSFDAAIADF